MTEPTLDSDDRLPDETGAAHRPTLIHAESSEGAMGSAPTQIGGYEILEELGRGGMGVVYKARQTSLKRLVALKMILHADQASSEERRRFQQESEALAQLKHENIVRVYEVGEIDEVPFFSLEYLEGGSLKSFLRGNPISGETAARLIETLARAIHCAHQNGIVHRDLKPENILLDTHEHEDLSAILESSPGSLKITDFGLAKRSQTDQTQTRTGRVMGSPSYMAPEQAEGRIKDIGPATDVHALGVLLYELLTGLSPFRGSTVAQTITKVTLEEPVSPRVLNPEVRRDLETICLKCLEKKPERRYESAEKLADDLRSFLRGEPISARSYNVISRLARTLELGQNYIAFKQWSTMLLLFALTILLGYSMIQWHILHQRFRWSLATYYAMYATLAVLFWRTRRGNILPNNSIERQLWTVWIGYFLVGGVTYIIGFSLYSRDWSLSQHVYPFHAAIGGMTWFYLGHGFWGGFYLIGLIYMMVAALMVLWITWGALTFGVLWAVTLTFIGLRLRYFALFEEE